VRRILRGAVLAGIFLGVNLATWAQDNSRNASQSASRNGSQDAAQSASQNASQNAAPKAMYDFSLPREEKIKLAESAAPVEVSGSATVYVLERSGYVKAREGTNGFSCFVDRQSPLNLEPTCFDAEGSATTLQSRFLAEELRGKGKSEDEIKAAIEEGYKSGKFRAPQKPGIVYMMSDAGYIFVAEMNKMVHLPEHLMFYAPYATDKDIGSPPSGANMPHLIRAGQPDAVIIVIPPVIPPVVKAAVKAAQ
jgi:hypothetical protein